MPGPLFSLSLLKEVFSSLLISFQVRGNPERSIGESGREMQNDYRLKKKKKKNNPLLLQVDLSLKMFKHVHTADIFKV